MASLTAFYSSFLDHIADPLAHNLSAATIGLGGVVNLPPISEANATTPNDDGYVLQYTASLMVEETITQRFMNAQSPGDIPYATLNTADPFVFDQLIEELAVVDNAEDLANQQTYVESFQRVFNSWERFAIVGGPNPPDLSYEADSFAYDPNTDSIYTTLDSNASIGLVSPRRYEHYVFDAQVSSQVEDDGAIALVVGYVHEGAERMMLGLSRIRYPDVPQLRLLYISTVNGNRIIAEQSDTYPNGTGPWSLIPNGYRIRVERDGDIFKFLCSRPNETVIDPEDHIEFTVDISNDPDLQRFRGPQVVGYAADTQNGATWHTYETPTSLNTIVDLVNNNVLERSNGSWDPSASTVNDHIQYGHAYFNPVTGKVFLGEGNGTAAMIYDNGLYEDSRIKYNDLLTRVDALENP